jgi:membrane-bound lytic murein transglycosylase D
MQFRDFLSRVNSTFRCFSFFFLCALSICTAVPAYAEEDAEKSIFGVMRRAVSNLTGATAASNDTLTTQELTPSPVFSGTIDLTAQPDDLWIRIRNGFAMSDLSDDLTLHYQQYYQNRPDALRRMVERSRPLMHYIVEQIEQRGMPTEIALLPMVESSFNPMAHSPAQASGLWQFIPATGKRFDLEQNWWQDQRRDIVASTDAALDYLQTNYEMHGDWHLALASYNWGEGAVKRAIEKNQARDMPTDYASLTMPNETRHYVPKLQALKNIFGDPALMARLNLPSISNRAYFSTIETSRPIDIKTAARLAEMPLDQFLALNPSHNRPLIKADTSLVIPNEKLQVFQNNLQAHRAPLSSWQAYTPRSNERLDRIAPRFGITLDDLRRVNGLHGKLKFANSTLLVPASNGNADLSTFEEPGRSPNKVKPSAAEKSNPKQKSAVQDKKPKKGKVSGKQSDSKPATGAAKAAKPAKASNDRKTDKTNKSGKAGKVTQQRQR